MADRALVDAVDLAQLSVHDLGEILEVAIDPPLQLRAGRDAFRRMSAWRWHRASSADRQDLDAPPWPPLSSPAGVAFPLAGLEGRRSGVGWIEVLPLAPPRSALDQAANRPLHGVIQAASSWLSRVLRDVPPMSFSLILPGPSAGESAGLAALLAALSAALGILPPDTLAATGALDPESLTLRPVEDEIWPGVLSAKIHALQKNGFRRLLVVQGQAGVPASPGLEIVEVPPPIWAALPVLFQTLTDSQDRSESAVLRLLLVLDRISISHPSRTGLTDPIVLALLDRFRGHPARAVRAVVHDLLARRALHLGETAQAQEHDRDVERSLAGAAIRDPWLDDYFDSHWIASRAILAIDAGLWGVGSSEFGSPIWRRLDSEIDALEARGRARLHRSAGDLYALLACRNARSFRHLFLARLEGDATALERSLADRLALRDSWDEVFSYARELRHEQTNLARQHNSLIDCLATAKTLGMEPPRIPGWRPWFLEAGAAPIRPETNPFDWHYRLVWFLFAGGMPGEIASEYASWTLRVRPPVGYPLSVTLENCALSHPDPGTRWRAARVLEESLASASGEDESSILSILRLRTLAVCGIVLRTRTLHELRNLVFKRSGETPLTELARRIVREPAQLSAIVARCPY
ncbi:MAG: hypothetical protein HY720_10320 [Planctomycetes bacterium]|nr:hypothetical protein [Planctomycetota bacterium]